MSSFLEKCYPFLPVWAQNLGISTYGAFYSHERLGGNFDAYVRSARKLETLPEDRFVEWTTRQLQQQLLRAYSQTRYYRELWDRIGVSPRELSALGQEDLCRLPTTPKADLGEDPGAFVSEDLIHRKAATHRTSGSTGTPISVRHTPDDFRRFMAWREARSFGWANASVRMPRSMIGGRMVVPRSDSRPPFHRYNLAEHQIYCSAYHISPRNAVHYIDAFNRHRPLVFTGYAYSHFLLGRMMLEQGLRLNYTPRALVLGSEKLTTEMKHVLLRAFGARAYEEYSAVENCMLATECECGGLHVNPDFGITEIVDDDNRPVPRGVEGRIVCTGLQNQAQMLIRYEIGDRGSWAEKDCPCGRSHLPLLNEITGRLEDVIVGPDGREMVRFHGIFVNLPHVLEGQIVQEQIDLIRARIVTTSAFGSEQAQLIEDRIRQRLGAVRVIIEPVAEIERTARGKFKAVISLLSPEQRRIAQEMSQKDLN